MYLLIVLFPLIGFLFGILMGRWLSLGVSLITTLCTFTSFLLSSLAFYNNLHSAQTVIVHLTPWLFSDFLFLEWSFCFDSLTCIMLVIVTFISTLVHLYSIEYMENDPHKTRFMSYLSLFTLFMLILVTANNFIQMFVGWEGVGLSSYLLINFWFTRIQANKSAIKAMLVNRIGDFFLLLAIFTLYFIFNTFNYDIIFSLIPLLVGFDLQLLGLKLPIVDLICFFIFFGAVGKSAQLGLHTWLPDAMEGPTPVSALIHAATMVTAGVFLVSRCSYIFEFSSFMLNLICFLGSCTAFFAATTGLFQNDMKKVIAYSTCSQLGYMMFACGLSSYDVGIFHLSNHAFFKALLFLSAGSVIHAAGDEQDMRKLGGLKDLLPFSYSMTLIGSLALIGFPFLSGFFSKDVILEVSYSKYTIESHFCFFLGCLAAFVTSFYSTRLLFLVFLSNTNGTKLIYLNAHEASWKMGFPLFVLSLASIFIGFLTKDIFVGFGTHFWGSSILVLPYNYSMVDIEFIPIFLKLLPLFVSFLGVSCSFLLYRFYLYKLFFLKKLYTIKLLYSFFNKKWYIDRIYNELLGQQFLDLCFDTCYKNTDRGLLEQFGPFGVVKSLNQISLKFVSYQTGYILDYVSFFCIAILTVLIPLKLVLTILN